MDCCKAGMHMDKMDRLRGAVRSFFLRDAGFLLTPDLRDMLNYLLMYLFISGQTQTIMLKMHSELFGHTQELLDVVQTAFRIYRHWSEPIENQHAQRLGSTDYQSM
jgi:hypothetical protein